MIMLPAKGLKVQRMDIGQWFMVITQFHSIFR